MRKSPTQIKVPEPPGKYEIRYIHGKSDATLARTELTITPASATVEAPATAVSGATIAVTWTGPKNDYDKIAIVAAGAPDKQRPLKSDYVRKSPTQIKVPEPPGKYEIRYVTGDSGSTLAKTEIAVGGASATVEAPATAVSGATIAVTWTGPKNDYDKIAIVAAGRGLPQQAREPRRMNLTGAVRHVRPGGPAALPDRRRAQRVPLIAHRAWPRDALHSNPSASGVLARVAFLGIRIGCPAPRSVRLGGAWTARLRNRPRYQATRPAPSRRSPMGYGTSALWGSPLRNATSTISPC